MYFPHSKINLIKKIKIWDKDNFQLLLILGLSSFLIYFTTPEIARVGYLFFLVAAYKSKKNYVWLAFLFIIIDTPNYFYWGQAGDDPTRVPLYSLGKGMSLGFPDLLMFVFFIKSSKKRFALGKIFQKELVGLSLLFIFYLLVSFLLGMKLSNFTLTMRSILPFGLIYIMPKLFRIKEEWFNFFKVLFPIVIFSFFGQIFYVFTSKPLAALLSPSMVDKVNLNFSYYALGVGLSRFYTGVFIGFMAFCAALYFLTLKKIKFNKFYLNLVVILALLQPVLSGTRAYAVAFLIILASWLLLQKVSQLPKFIFFTAMILLLLFLSIRDSPIIGKQVDRSFERLSTVSFMLKGDITAGGTSQRISERTPRVLKKFNKSPVFGFGFSDEFYEYNDDHVGIPNTLLNLGVVGFAVFHGMLFSLIIKIAKLRKTRKQSLESLLFLIGLLGIFAIHILGRQIFGIIVGANILFFTIIYFTFWLFFITNPDKDILTVQIKK